MELPQVLNAGVGADVARLLESEIRGATHATVVELNSACLALLARQALVLHANASPLLGEFSDLWSGLDVQARQRAAACPYLLFDIGFADATRWSGDPATLVNAPRGFFTISEAPAVARQVFLFAWHLVQSTAPAAKLFLGIPEHCGDLIASLTLPQIHEIADRHPEWLRPRWPALLSFWRELLLAAKTADDIVLLRARMRGLRLLAADLDPDLSLKYGVTLRRRTDNQALHKARSIPGTGQVEDEILPRHGLTPPHRLFYDRD